MRTILIVENNGSLGDMLATYFHQIGHKVLLASNAEVAILKAQAYEGVIHLLLTNLFLTGGINGKQLAQRLQAIYPNMETVFISSSEYSELLSQGIDIAADRFFQKPFPFDRFSDTVKTLLAPPEPPSSPPSL